MKRIFLITRIVPSGRTGRNTKAGISWELPLGMLPSPKWSYPKKQQKEKRRGREELLRRSERSEKSGKSASSG
jgi:hypothetical protein